MTRCNSRIKLGNLHGKQITGGFEGGDISTDGGLIFVQKADRRLKLTDRLSAALTDRRDPAKVKHSLAEMTHQRVYQIACGYWPAPINGTTCYVSPSAPAAMAGS